MLTYNDIDLLSFNNQNKEVKLGTFISMGYNSDTLAITLKNGLVSASLLSKFMADNERVFYKTNIFPNKLLIDNMTYELYETNSSLIVIQKVEGYLYTL